MTAKQVLHQRCKERALSAEYVRSILNYDPDTGLFTWRARRGSKYPGDRAGKRKPRGYIDIRINNISYRAHRLAFLIMTGRWPHRVVDHIDRNPSNNTWVNLRDTAQSTNCLNCERSDRVALRKSQKLP